MPQIFYLTHVSIESGALGQLPSECTRVGIRRPLIVTDVGIRAAGLMDKLMDVLGSAKLESIMYMTPHRLTQPRRQYARPLHSLSSISVMA